MDLRVVAHKYCRWTVSLVVKRSVLYDIRYLIRQIVATFFRG